MIDELLDLWIVRLAGRTMLPKAKEAAKPLAKKIQQPKTNVLVDASSLREGRYHVIHALRLLAYTTANLEDDDKADKKPSIGWLAVDVPIPNQATPEQLVHRMIRRLYFAAVLHGLAEIPMLRDAVQSLRMSYLQTRGSVTASNSSQFKANAGIGLSFDLTQPIKLTASEELTVAESISAQMQRMGLMEAEDQLVYDLHILMRLNGYITRYADVQGWTLPRWEQISEFFKACYARFDKKSKLTLRPVFVLEATSLGATVSLLQMLSAAASMAAAQGAQLVIIAGPLLVRAYQLDQQLGQGVFRGQFDLHSLRPGVTIFTDPQRTEKFQGVDRWMLKRMLEDRKDLDPAVVAILHALENELPKPT